MSDAAAAAGAAGVPGRFDARGLLRRALGALVVVWVVVTTVFAVVHLAPGDSRRWLDDPRVPESQRARIREIYGVDDPLAVRYGRWVSAALRGDFGLSVTHQEPVFSQLGRVHDVIIGPDGYLYVTLQLPGQFMSQSTPGMIARLIPVSQ